MSFLTQPTKNKPPAKPSLLTTQPTQQKTGLSAVRSMLQKKTPRSISGYGKTYEYGTSTSKLLSARQKIASARERYGQRTRLGLASRGKGGEKISSKGGSQVRGRMQAAAEARLKEMQGVPA